jgi:hypothetical protein
MDMDENDGMRGLKGAALTTAAMFVLVSVSGINFANPIFCINNCSFNLNPNSLGACCSS